jgi:hypothetical protein
MKYVKCLLAVLCFIFSTANASGSESLKNTDHEVIHLNVHMWTVELPDAAAVPDLRKIFVNGDAGTVTGNLATFGRLGAASCSAQTGRLKPLSDVTKSLAEWGDARWISSGGGQMRVNEQFPIVAIRKDGATGKAISGFAMTFTPRIQTKKRLIIQYGIFLAGKNEIRNEGQADMSHAQSMVLAGFVPNRALSDNEKPSVSQSNVKTLLIVVMEVGDSR